MKPYSNPISFVSNVSGIFYNIPILAYGDGLSVQIEMVYSSFESGLDFSEQIPNNPNANILDYNYVGVPVMLKYKIAGQTFSPFCSFGKSTGFAIRSKSKLSEAGLFIHKMQKSGLFFEVGSEYRIHKGFSVYSNFRFQTHYNMVIDEAYERSTPRLIVNEELYETILRTNSLTVMLGVQF